MNGVSLDLQLGQERVGAGYHVFLVDEHAVHVHEVGPTGVPLVGTHTTSIRHAPIAGPSTAHESCISASNTPQVWLPTSR